MFCPKCGCQNDNTNSFCQGCGAQLQHKVTEDEQKAAFSQAATPQSAPAGNQYASKNGFAQSSQRSPVARMKALGSSPLFIASAILFSLSAFLSFVSSISSVSTVSSLTYYLSELFDEIGLEGLDYFIGGFGRGLGATMLMFTLIGMIPTFIIVAGIWLVFAAARNRNVPYFNPKGLSLLKGLSTFYIVMTYILGGLAVLALLIALIASGSGASVYSDYAYSYGDGGYGSVVSAVAGVAMTVIVFVIIVVALIVTFSVLYYSKLRKTLKGMISTAQTGVAVPYSSGFVMVMCFVSAVFSFFSLFGSNGIGILSTLCSCAASVCFGIILVQYKKIVSPAPVYNQGYSEASPYYAPSNDSTPTDTQ